MSSSPSAPVLSAFVRVVLFRRRRWWLAALSLAGIICTHLVSYGVVAPQHAHREALLHDTGHDIWPAFVIGLALAAVVAGTAGSFLEPRQASIVHTIRPTAARLATLQAVGWLSVELFERVTSADTDWSLRATAPAALGVLLQILVATACAVLLKLLHAAVSAFMGRRPPRAWPEQLAWSISPPPLPVHLFVATSRSPRAPPAPSL